MHKTIQFNQCRWLTKFRTESNTDFQKALFKLKNNLIFGKTIQNNRKQRDVWHANNEKN